MTRPPHSPSGREHYEQLFTDMCRVDPQVHAAAPRREIRAAALRPELSLAESVAAIMEGYADRPALGERVTEVVTDQATGSTGLRLTRRFATISYRELWSRADAVAAEWHHDSRAPVRPGDFVASLGFISSDYTAIELACIRLGVVSVPLQASAPPGNLKPIIAETGPRVLAVSAANLGTAIEAVADSRTVHKVVVFDYADAADAHRHGLEAARSRLVQAGSEIVIDTLEDVVARGSALPASPVAPVDPANPDPLSLLIYTSGSTGTPKGGMYTERVAKELWREYWPGKDHPLIGLHFMPMSHVVGRLVLFNTLSSGGTAYFPAKPDLSTMLEDFELVRPTDLVLVPRICDMLYQHFQRELDRRAHAAGHSAGLAAEVKDELRTKTLGGRIVWAGCGSAPLSTEMTTFIESVLGLSLHDAYGSTEAGGLALLDGKPGPQVQEYRLVDVPELGYFRTDAPHPRGELLIKSATLVDGYFNRPETTAQVFDAEGFFHTGDIMAEIEPGRLAYVDRRNNVLKLSQGEFVTLSKLEAVFAASPLIRQIYVYGNSERAYLLAVVVPTSQALTRAGDDPHLVRTAIAGSLRQLAKDADLSSYEIPRDFIVETEPFTVESGLLSGLRKLVRPKLEEHYGGRLEALYAAIAEREASEVRQLRESGRDQPVTDTVVRAAHALLGASSGAPSPDARFADLGGDSLSALEFSSLLQEIFQVEVPVSVVISAASDLRGISRHIEYSLRHGGARTTFAAVHGGSSIVVRAADLTLEKFIDDETLAKAAALPRNTGLPHGTGAAQTVLLTGANGYLGRFLCLEWLERLERMAETGGRLVCVIRGNSPEAARARLDDAFGHGDGGLPRRFRDLAAGHLEVLLGDIGKPSLGLDETTWHELAEAVDLIVHPAALVNHVLPYQHLFGPNVVGTAELIRLALTTRIKPVTYLSTVAAVATQVSSADESSDIRVTSPERTLDESYGCGYATSKWAGEVLLREAHDAFRLPVAAFRPDMILAHSRFPGQLNVPDMFTRLLLSLVTTGIAPGSFYAALDPAHYDGLPADFVAEAIVTLGRAVVDGYHTYNVLNPHEDGISLDTFVDWLADAGYVIKRIDDYATWFSRFETAIRALPEKQKQHSLLPLLHAFAQPAAPVDGAGIPTGLFRSAVRASGLGTGGRIPHVTPALIRKYAADLRDLGLI